MLSPPVSLANEPPEPEPGYARRGPGKLILIAGGGIGGLAAALALAKRGIASHVLERRPAFAEDGAGIQIGPNGTKILAGLGVADQLRPLVSCPGALRVLDATTGRDLARLPLGPWIERRHGAPYWVAHRQDLHAALLARVREEPLVRVTAGAEVVAVLADADRVAARTADGRTSAGDALVAADGLWSRLRSRFIDPAPPRFMGKSAARSVIPREAVPDKLRRNETHLWLAPGLHVVHYPVRAGAEVAMVVIFDDPNPSDEWGSAIDPAALRDRARPAAEDLRELIARPEAWRKWSLHALASRRSWTRGRITLLGDAAHPVLPFLAQGGVLALEDAVVLAQCLSAAGVDIARGLGDYERRRRSRVRRVERASRLNGRMYHLNGVPALLRDRLLAAVPPERIMAGYDWLYGWTLHSLSPLAGRG